MDIVGVDKITAEVELLAAVVEFFRAVGITSKDVGFKINSRKVLGAVLKMAGVQDQQFAEVCIVVDKLDKIGPDAVLEQLTGCLKLPQEVAQKVVDATKATSLDELATLSGTQDSEAVAELKLLFELCDAYGFGDWLIFDASVVRGLAYYTGVVFECFDREGELRAICGGGRYDRLLTLYGSPKEIPCVGFGFGDCVIMELLMERGKMPSLPREVDYVITAYNEEMMGPALSVAKQLRKGNKTVDVMPEPAKKVAKAFNYADRCGARRVAFVAPDEWAKKCVRIKDLREQDENKKQVDVPFDQLHDVEPFFGGMSVEAGEAAHGQAVASAPSSAPAATAEFTLYCRPGDFKTHKVMVAAKINGVEVAVMDGTAQARLGPTETLPYLKTREGVLFTSNAITRYVARSRRDTQLMGGSFLEEGQVDSWMDFSTHQLEVPLLVLGSEQVPAEATKAAQVELRQAVAALEKHLEGRVFLVGDTLTLADVSIVCALARVDAEIVKSGKLVAGYLARLRATQPFQGSL